MLNSRDFQKVVDIFLKSHKIFNDYFLKEGISIQTKQDGSKVTECDLVINKLFYDHLEKLGIPIVSEEKEITAYNERKNWKKLWILDPLDGTHSFLKGKKDFGSLLALVEDRRPILSFMYFPILDIMYFSALNEGTFILKDFYNILKEEKNISFEQLKNISQKIKVNSPKELPLKIMLPKREDIEKEDLYFKKLEEKYVLDITRMSSCRRFACLLEGQFHFSFRFFPIHEWDLVAGDLILHEAGMKVTTVEDELILYNTPQFNISSVKCFFDKNPYLF